VVIIADKDKEEMDEIVKDELDNLQPRAKLSVTTRTGSPSELSSMQRAAAGTAQRIIVTQADAFLLSRARSSVCAALPLAAGSW
jgi:hypothetical protein